MFGLTFLLNVPERRPTGTAPNPAWWVSQRMLRAKACGDRIDLVALIRARCWCMPRAACTALGGLLARPARPVETMR
jgi:hypothetical protein